MSPPKNHGPRFDRAWWLPSLGVAVGLAFFLALTLSGWRIKLISADGDPSWHWAQGAWMIEHGSLLQADPFSHTRAGAPLIEMWWLADLLFAAAGNLLGWNGIVLLSAGLIAATMWLLYRIVSRAAGEPLLALLLTLLAAAVCATHWLARPHLFTHLLALGFAWQFHRFDRGELTPRRALLVLPGLMVIWANLHGAFVTGLVLAGCYFLGRAWTIRSPHRALRAPPLGAYAALGLACAVASLVNPFGWRLHAHVAGYLLDPTLVSFVQEYASPNLLSVVHLPLLLLLLLLVLVLVLGRSHLRAGDRLVCLVVALLALRSARNAPVFALVATPIIAVATGPLAGWLRRWPTAVRLAAVDRHADGRGLAGVAVLAVVAVMAWPVVTGAAPWLRTGIPADRYPVDAVRFLRENPGAVSGNLFNDMVWGGYLILALPEHRVFFDGRVDFYGPRIVGAYNEIDDLEPGWETGLDRHGIGWTLLPRAHRLNEALARRPDWRPVYADAVATLYGRLTP